MNVRRSLFLPLILAVSLAACKKQDNSATEQPSEAAASTAAPATAPAPSSEPAAAAPAAPVKAFDLNTVPVHAGQVPAFPYMATPSTLKADDVFTDHDIEFDKTYVVAGQELRRVEGRIHQRSFYLHTLKMSPLAAHRNYETALKAMGATRVDKVHPHEQAFIDRNGGNAQAIFDKMGLPYINLSEDAEVPGYEQWLLRTPSTNIWLSFFLHSNGDKVGLRVVEEKAMEQVVWNLPAAELSKALQRDGHVAMYLNFDTDSHVIRADSLPAVDEVVKLLQSEPKLNLRVEGHTDATGDAARNRKLSLARAESVVKAITAKQIAASRLSAVGKGPDQPLADNASEEGKAKNRRVELVRV